MQTGGKAASRHQRVGFGGDQQSFERAPSTSRAGLSSVSRSQSSKCSDCPDRNCLNCPLKKKGCKSKCCTDCSVNCKDCSVNCMGSDKCSDNPDRNCLNCPLKKNCKGCDIKKQKESWWALKPFSFWPADKQQGEEKEVEEGIKGKLDKKKEEEGGKPAWWAFWKRG